MKIAAFWTVIFSLFYSANSRGSGVRKDLSTQPVLEEKKYPSQTRKYYYSYYINYFSPSGLRYAASKQNSPRTVSVCKNMEPYFNNETFLGVFPCPMEKDPDDFAYCCGESNYEYCCRRKDTVNFKVMVGCVVVAILGAIIVIVACVVIFLNKKRSENDNKEQGQKRNIVANQSDDGYTIFVQFKSKKFYTLFWNHLYEKYNQLSWKYIPIEEDHEIKEGKITLDDGNWVSVALNDDVDGKPIMTVSREKAAVSWMRGPFEEILQEMPDENKSCCFSKKRRTHPERREEEIAMEKPVNNGTNMDEHSDGNQHSHHEENY